MIPATTERVPQNTAEQINERIRERTRANVAGYSQAGPAAVARRLRELDHEWDIERVLEANAASVVLLGTALGAFVDRRFYFLPAMVGTFLLQHAIQGWCPPVPLFRRLGVRTQTEIDEEKMALKALRGDFKHAAAGPAPARAQRAMNAARA
jgi:Protein of unknown function (DUF2892)